MDDKHVIRPVELQESNQLVQLAINTGIFPAGEAEELLGGTLRDLFGGNLGSGHQAHVLHVDGDIKGWVYFSPTDSSSVWNLWWIGVDPQFAGKGYGKALLQFVEQTASSSGASRLIIETSGAPNFEHTQQFYARQLYKELRREPDAYAPGEDKIVFYKDLL